MRKAVSVAAAVLALMMSPGAARAVPSLIGDSVAIIYYYPDLFSGITGDSVVVGTGSELVCPGAFDFCALELPIDIDFVADSVTVRFGTEGNAYPGIFNGFSFEGLDFGPGYVLAGVALDTNMGGLDAADVSFGDRFARVNIQGLSFDAGTFFALNFTVRQTGVAEPAAMGLFGLGLLMIGAGLRRRVLGSRVFAGA